MAAEALGAAAVTSEAVATATAVAVDAPSLPELAGAAMAPSPVPSVIGTVDGEEPATILLHVRHALEAALEDVQQAVVDPGNESSMGHVAELWECEQEL